MKAATKSSKKKVVKKRTTKKKEDEKVTSEKPLKLEGDFDEILKQIFKKGSNKP